jgi:hypothetical protein
VERSVGEKVAWAVMVTLIAVTLVLLVWLGWTGWGIYSRIYAPQPTCPPDAVDVIDCL